MGRKKSILHKNILSRYSPTDNRERGDLWEEKKSILHKNILSKYSPSPIIGRGGWGVRAVVVLQSLLFYAMGVRAGRNDDQGPKKGRGKLFIGDS